MSDRVPPGYSLGSTDAELRRLIELAAHEVDHVIEACRRAYVDSGATVLDLGCGPLGALVPLAGVVGRQGKVIGVDASAAALARARTLLPAEAFPHVRFVEGDVNEIGRDALGIVRVDAAYARLMLLHQADPARTVRNVARLLRKGGVFLVHEASDSPSHAPASEPHVPALARVWELVIAAARARGANTDFARKGRTYLEAAGFTIEGHRAYAVHYPPDIGYEIPRVALQSLRPVLEEHGLASEHEVARLDREIEDAKRADGVQWVSGPLMIEWIGRLV